MRSRKSRPTCICCLPSTCEPWCCWRQRCSLAYGLFFFLIGVPYGILLAAIAFFLEFIPVLGPLVAAVAILMVAGLSGFQHLLWILVFLAVFRIFQEYVLSPRLMSKGTKLQPVMVIFGILAGGQIAGIPGIFLAVPVLAILRIVYRQLKKKLLTPRSTSPGQESHDDDKHSQESLKVSASLASYGPTGKP